MICIAVTQRVDVVESHGERRDALDQRWMPLIERCGLAPLLLPNRLETARRLIEAVHCSGVLLTGGGDLEAYGGNTPERDRVEKYLIQYCIEHGLPVLGVCRGMQAILHYFGVPLVEVAGHAAARHAVRGEAATREVNSYHRFGTLSTSDGLRSTAVSPDGIVEAVRHEKWPIYGVMWHPERDYSDADIDLIVRVFQSAGSCNGAHL